VLSLLLLFAPSYADACEDSLLLSELTEVSARAQAAYVAVDQPAFQDATDELIAGVPCLSETMDGAAAASIHRSMALRFFRDRDLGAAALSLAAVRGLEPWYAPSEELMPPGHPLRTLFDGAVSTGAMTPLSAPEVGSIHFDGSPADGRPVDRASIVQWIDAETVHWSVYAAPSVALPEYPALAPTRPPRWPWVAGGLAGASAMLYGGAAYTRLRYDASGLEDRRRLAGWTNGLVLSSALVAGGAGVAAAVGLAGGP